MAESDGNRQVVIASMFAVMLAVGSLSLSWFSASCANGRYCEFAVTEYYVSGDGWREYDTSWGFGDMGSLLGLAVLFIVIWCLLAIIHVGLILGGERGVVSGVLLMGASAASVIIPCVGASSAIVDGLSSYYSSTSSVVTSVDIKGGCALAIVAALIQVVAVAARLILARSETEAEDSPEANRGDLPIR